MAHGVDTFMTPSQEASDLEELMSVSEPEAPRGPPQRGKLAAVAGLLCFVGACVCIVKAVSLAQAPVRAPLPARPVTVRSLLEGDEFADLATDNVMALGGEQLAQATSRDQVRAAVAARLRNISGSIQRQHPEAHAKLDLIQLSDAQWTAALDTVRHFGDHRMISLSRDLADAVQETAQTSGDETALQRRLLEKLRPRAGELEQLGEELFPVRGGKGLALDFGSLGDVPATEGFKQWHVQVGISRPEVGSAQAARRLSEVDFTSSTDIQAQSLFHKLGDMLPEEMPQAPARMLYEQQHANSGKEGFVDCMMRQMKEMDPMGCMGCAFANMQAVFQMVSRLMMGKH